MTKLNLALLSKQSLTAVTLVANMIVPVGAMAQTAASPITAYPAGQMGPPIIAQSYNRSPVALVPTSIVQPVTPKAPVVQVVVEPVVTELAAATAISVTPVNEITTKKLVVGDHVDLMTSEAVVRGGRVFIPAKAHVTAIVTEAVGRRAFGRGGQMAMKFETLKMPDGSTLSLSGIHTETGSRADGQAANNLGQTGAALAGGFGAVGVLAGLFARAVVTGSSATIKPGAKLEARTAQPLHWNANNTVSIASIPEVKGSDEQSPAAISLPTKEALSSGTH
jgi:hypothetical protein